MLLGQLRYLNYCPSLASTIFQIFWLFSYTSSANSFVVWCHPINAKFVCIVHMKGSFAGTDSICHRTENGKQLSEETSHFNRFSSRHDANSLWKDHHYELKDLIQTSLYANIQLLLSLASLRKKRYFFSFENVLFQYKIIVPIFI